MKLTIASRRGWEGGKKVKRLFFKKRTMSMVFPISDLVSSSDPVWVLGERLVSAPSHLESMVPRFCLGTYNGYSHSHFILASLLSLVVLPLKILPLAPCGLRFLAAHFNSVSLSWYAWYHRENIWIVFCVWTHRSLEVFLLSALSSPLQPGTSKKQSKDSNTTEWLLGIKV